MALTKSILLMFVIPLLCINCKKKEENPPMNHTGTAAKKVKYLALGDSYTKGESVAKEVSFPYQLQTKLNATGEVEVTQVKIIAETGWTTASLQNAINSAAIKDTFDFVTLLIGVNNQYQQKPIQNYHGEFLALLNDAIRFAGGNKTKVAVLSIPDYGATPFGSGNAAQIGKEIDQYNTIAHQIADSLQIKYFDITPISRQATTDPSLIAYDDLHPSGKMYGLWVDIMYQDILERVR